MSNNRIASVTADADYTLVVTFENGKTFRVDISDIVDELAVFSPLSSGDAFARVRVGEFGWFIEWPEAPNASLSSDTLWRRALEQAGEAMPAAEFKAWRLVHGLSLQGAADALGISRRQIAYFDSGEKIIGKTIMLACRGYTHTNPINNSACDLYMKYTPQPKQCNEENKEYGDFALKLYKAISGKQRATKEIIDDSTKIAHLILGSWSPLHCQSEPERNSVPMASYRTHFVGRAERHSPWLTEALWKIGAEGDNNNRRSSNYAPTSETSKGPRRR